MEENEYLKKLGKRITEKREASGISITELGRKVELSRTQLYRIEAGESPSNIIYLRRIASELGISISNLVKVD